MTAPGGGPLRFARYAYPPNALGYCGPADAQALLEYTAAGVADGGLTDLAQRFEGAWPYLQIIAAANGIDDPLDEAVVAAYWVGNELLDKVTPGMLGNSLDERFRRRAGGAWSELSEPVGRSARASHAFHVFGVYPWVGLLRGGVGGQRPLHVLDRCRVRWGRVDILSGDVAVVTAQPLVWDGRDLRLDVPRAERVSVADDGRSLAGAISPGDWVSLHWDWICEPLSDSEMARLRNETLAQLAAVNAAHVSWVDQIS